jgi:F-type H+-transporting ATPase subunit b
VTRAAGAALGLALLAGARLALAASGEPADHGHAESGSGLGILLFQVLNLAILGFILYRFAGPALRDYLAQRSRAIREQIEGAQRSLAAAQTELEELRRRLARADDEAREIAEQAARAAKAERARIVARAAESAERLRVEARRIADQEIARARLSLQAETAQLATQLAADVLRQRLTEDDDRRLVADFARRVDGAS